MAGRHRAPSAPRLVTGPGLARVGALVLLASAPLAVAGTAAASPGGPSRGVPVRHMYDDDGGHDEDSADQRDDTSDSMDRRASRQASRADRDQDGRDRARPAIARHRHRNTDDSDNEDSDDYSSSDARKADTSATDTVERSTHQRYSDAKWDRLANCESSQEWSTDTGNGYTGGLQFSDATWRAYGGQRYAPSADQASREEQIAVAEKVQRDQGWQAWPSCSSKLGYA